VLCCLIYSTLNCFCLIYITQNTVDAQLFLRLQQVNHIYGNLVAMATGLCLSHTISHVTVRLCSSDHINLCLSHVYYMACPSYSPQFINILLTFYTPASLYQSTRRHEFLSYRREHCQTDRYEHNNVGIHHDCRCKCKHSSEQVNK
jgi:hypothetical protein